MVQAGWSDAAANPVGLRYTGMLREVLGPLSTSMSQYVNLLDVAEGAGWLWGGAAVWCAEVCVARVVQGAVCLVVPAARWQQPTHQWRPLAPGCPVCADLDMSYESAAAKAGGAANLEKIRALKAKYDPTGVFLNSPYTKVLAVKP